MMNENNNGINVNPVGPELPGMNANPVGPEMPNPGMNVNPVGPEMPNPEMNVNPVGPEIPNPEMNANPVGPEIPNSEMNAPKKKNKFPIIIGIVAAVVLAAVVAIIFLSGGNKTLTCKQEQAMGMGMSMNATVDFNFVGKNVESADMNIEVDLGDYASFKDTFIKQFENEYASYAEKGLDVKITSSDSKIFINFNASKQKFEDAGLSTASTYNEVKSDMETQGFVCE